MKYKILSQVALRLGFVQSGIPALALCSHLYAGGNFVSRPRFLIVIWVVGAKFEGFGDFESRDKERK